MRGVFMKGNSIYLAPLEVSCIENYMKWFNDTEVTRYLAMYYPVNSFCERKYIENSSRASDQVAFDLFLNESDRHIGNCALTQIDWVNRRCVFGSAIGEKDCWGKGYGTEATILCVEYAFNRLNLHRVGLEVYTYNDRAAKVYKKAGFTEEGRLRDSKFMDGRYHDTILMSKLNPLSTEK